MFDDRRHEISARLTEAATLDGHDFRRKALRGKKSTGKKDNSLDFTKGRKVYYMLRPEGMFLLTSYLVESSFLTLSISFTFEYLELHSKLWRVCIF